MACHIPTGGLDSRNLREALLTLPELAVEDRFLVLGSLMVSTLDKGVSRGGELASFSLAIIEELAWFAMTAARSYRSWKILPL